MRLVHWLLQLIVRLFQGLARLCWHMISDMLIRGARWFRKKPLRIVWGVVLLMVVIMIMPGDSASMNVLLPVMIPLALLLAALRYIKVFGRFGGKY